MREGRIRHSFWATDGLIKALIVANCAVFLLQAVFGLLPRDFGAMSLDRLQHGQLWTLATYAFVHANLMHLLMNMLVLWFLGRGVEQLLGPRAFLWIYTGGALAGAGLHLTLEFFFGRSAPVIGASGAVFAVVAALATMLPNIRLQFLFIPISFKAWQIVGFAVGMTAILVVFSLFSGDQAGGIAHTVHLGGALFGFAWVRWNGLGKGDLSPQDFMRLRQERERRSDRVVLERWRKRFGADNVVEADFRQEPTIKQAQVDAILEKIHREGMGALDEKERAILRRASETMAGESRDR